MVKNLSVAMISVSAPTAPQHTVYSFVFDEARSLAEKGVDVHIVRPMVERDFSSCGVRYHGIQKKIDLGAVKFMIKGLWAYLPIALFRNPRYIYRESLYALNISKIIIKQGTDIIHAHFAYPEGFVASLAKKATKKPLVISVWGYDVQSDPKSGYGALSRIDTAYLVRKALMAADAIIVGAETHYKTVIQLIGEEKRYKVHFISAGIDTVRFNPNVDGSIVRKKLGIRADQLVVLFARHLQPIYGTEYLIKAIPYVIEKCPNTVFLILGEGLLLVDLQRLVDTLKVAHHVKFLGQVPLTDMPYYHAASDIFVDPCIMGQGYAALEALACSKPVVGFKIGQTKVENRKDGFLVEFGDIEEIARKIIWLVENPSERQKMGVYGRKRVEKHCSLRSRINDIISLYGKMMPS